MPQRHAEVVIIGIVKDINILKIRRAVRATRTAVQRRHAVPVSKRAVDGNRAGKGAGRFDHISKQILHAVNTQGIGQAKTQPAAGGQHHLRRVARINGGSANRNPTNAIICRQRRGRGIDRF